MANLRTNNLSGEQGQNAYRGSVYFPPSSYLTIANNSDFSFGTGDFTVECWVYITNHINGATDVIVSTYQDGSNGWSLGIHGHSPANKFYFAIAGDSSQLDSSVLYTDSWVHLAASRSGSTAKFFINGREVASASNSTNQTSTSALHIGTNVGGGSLETEGFISNLRIIKGTAIYTSDFTPPTSELTMITNTVLLCCQDSNDPTQEATGKTITGNGNLATAGYLETQPKFIPPFGVDAGNTFGGPIQQSSQGYMYFPTGRTEEKGGGIAIVGGGYSAATSPIGTIESIIIQTMGNSKAFGTLNAARFSSGVVASRSRVIFGGGYQPSNLNSMEFVNPITQGNGTDAGDLGAARKMIAGLGNSTRGIFAGGNEPSPVNTIEFVTIASLGDAVNFGDLTAAVNNPRGCASPTRGIINCATAPSSRSNVINFITIASAGDAQDFGDLTETFGMSGFGLSDNTRGVIGGYYTAPSNTNVNTINFVTIATTGDATDFGDMVTGTGHGGSGCSDRTRGVIFGQYTNAPFGDAPLYADGQGAVNLIQMITVQTTGNAVEFGDLTANVASLGRKYYCNGNSNSHGGLS